MLVKNGIASTAPSLVLQVTIKPGIADAQQSSIAALPAALVAGEPAQLVLTVRDACGNLTDSAEPIAILLDTSAEGELMALCTNCCMQQRL